MLAFYRRLYPFKSIFTWLNHEHAPTKLFTHREFAFTLQGDVYLRYNSFANAEELKKQGTTWAEVVSRAVEEKSFKEPPPPEPIKPGEGSVAQLIEEAEELKKLLDSFGDRLVEGVAGEGPAVSATGGIP